MPPLSRSGLLYLFTGCALVGLLVIASAYVLNPRGVSLNVSFDPPEDTSGRTAGMPM